jgi:hypothetical protein
MEVFEMGLRRVGRLVAEVHRQEIVPGQGVLE